MEDVPLLKANGAKSASILWDLDDPNRSLLLLNGKIYRMLKNSQNLTSYVPECKQVELLASLKSIS